MAIYFMEHHDKNGLYNLGTGKARTWNDLVTAVFNAMGKEPNIQYIEMPETLRSKYQYFTEANISKLRNAGYDKDIYSLEKGVKDYVTNYLIPQKTIAW